MANVELSRRVAPLMTMPVIQELNLSEYKRFIFALITATTFLSLALRWKEVIIRAEKELVSIINTEKRKGINFFT